MKNLKLVLVALLMGVALQSKAFGGIYSVSPDEKTIAYSPGNYSLYLLDATTFAVKERMRLEKNPEQSFNPIYTYSPDGKTFLFSAGWDILVLNTENWQVKRKIKKEGDIFISHDNSQFVLYDEKKITIYDMNTANITKTIMVEIDEDDVEQVVFSRDNSKLIILNEEHDSKTEEDKGYGYKDFDGLSEKEEIEKDHMNDGKETTYTIIDIATAKVEKTKTLWFSSSSMEVVALPENSFVVANRDGIVKIDNADKITVYNVEGGSNYGFDATNNLLIYTSSFCGLNVFNFEYVNEIDLKNKYVSFIDNCTIKNGKYYIAFNEYCLASCTKGGVSVAATPIY